MKQIPVEVYTRVVGYFRPTSQWNKGKRAELAERINFRVSEYRASVECDGRINATEQGASI
jgi:hypothetical protein